MLRAQPPSVLEMMQRSKSWDLVQCPKSIAENSLLPSGEGLEEKGQEHSPRMGGYK